MKHAALLSLCLLFSFWATAQNSFDALTDKGYQELSDGKSVAAKHTLEKALKVLPKHLDPELKADFFNNLGVTYYQTGAYKKGLDAYEISLEIYKKLSNDSLVAGALLNLGLAYKEIGAFKQATLTLTNAARISERYGNRQELSAAWNAIGNIQRETGNYEKALNYHHRALAIRKTIGYDKGTADSYHNIGAVYLEWKRYDKAEYYLQEALNRKKVLDNQSNTVNTLSALGRLYVAKQESTKALFYLNAAYTIRKEAGNSAKAASSLYYLGTYYASIGDRFKAEELFRQVQDLARSSRDHSLLADALMSEINLLKTSRNNDPLLEKYRELVETRELSTIDENHKEIARLEIEYDVERKEREIEMRREQAKLDKIELENEALRNQQLIGWIIGLSVLAVTVTALFYQIRRRKQQIEIQNRELEEQNEEIIHLHQELSHRTKNYLGLLSGILKSDRSQVKHPEAVEVLEGNIYRLEAMAAVLRYLLDDSTRENKEIQLDIFFSDFIDDLVLNLFPQKRKLKVVKAIEAIYLDYDVVIRLTIALNELICNSIEHGLVQVTEPELSISLTKDDHGIQLVVRDNGPGISEQLLTVQTKGQQLIQKLLRKIDGSVQYSNDKGCIATVSVKT